MLVELKRFLRENKRKLFAEITEIPEVLQPSYFPGLDGLRAIAIIIVLLGHSLMGTWWVDYFPGPIGVDIFFVISGFLITTLLLKEKVKNGRVSLKNFYIRRILRIFPVAYLYLFSLVILGFVFNIHTSLKMLLVAGLYIGNFPVQNGNNWQTAHFWSLAVEEQFYLAFPFILIKSPTKYLFLVLAITISLPFIVDAGRLSVGPQLAAQIFHKLFLFLTFLLGYGTLSIVIGSLISVLLFKKIVTLGETMPYYLSFIVFILAIFLHVKNLIYWNLMIYIFPLLIGCVIVLNLKRNNFFSLILNHPIMVKIGILSYSIYIWQQLFTYDQPWGNLFKNSNSILLNFVALIFVAYSSYYFYEQKFLKLKTHFKKI